MELGRILMIVFFAALGGWSFGRYVGYASGREGERKAAIKAGVAEYVVNKTTGDTAFTYKTIKD